MNIFLYLGFNPKLAIISKRQVDNRTNNLFWNFSECGFLNNIAVLLNQTAMPKGRYLQ